MVLIKINLLDPQLVKKEERNEIMYIVYAIVVVVVLCELAFYGVKYKDLASIEGKIQKAEKELAQNEAIVKKVDELQATKTILQTKKDIISTLVSYRLLYPKLMEDMLMVLPEGIWFAGINTILTDGGKMEVKVDAGALTPFAISELLSALSADRQITELELGAINTVKNDAISSSLFSFNFKHVREKREP